MRVGINGLLLSTRANYRRTGVSRYIESLLAHLPPESDGDELIAYVDRGIGELAPGMILRRTRLSVQRARTRVGWEHITMPMLSHRDGLDLFHGTVNVLPFGLACPAVVTIHDLAFLRSPEQVTARRYRYLKWMVRSSARRAEVVIVPSVATGEDVEELLRVPADRIAVVPLGVSDRFGPASDGEIARAKERYLLTKPYVLAVGTIEPRKNLPRLIEAMGLLRDDVEEELVLAGPSGWLTDEVERAIAKSGLGERIRRPGYIEDDDLVPLYSAASVVAMPSLYEGFGLPVLEAMACGATVVTSNVSSLPEVAGDAAILVDPLSVESIADGVRTAISGPELRATQGRAAMQRAGQFTWTRTARETMAVYRSAAG